MRFSAPTLALFLAGAASALAAPPQTALEARTEAVKSCLAKPRTTYAAHTECLLAADAAFLAATRFSDRRAWETYTARMRQAGADADAGKLTEDGFAARILTIKAQLPTI